MTQTDKVPRRQTPFLCRSVLQLVTFFVLLIVGALNLSVKNVGATSGNSQDSLFGLTNLWIFHLKISAEEWRRMSSRSGEANPQPGILGGLLGGLFGESQRVVSSMSSGSSEYPWATCTFECGGQTFTNVGIRFKGHSSFKRAPNSLKRPFKLDFNRQAKGRKFRGVEEFFLNNNVNDATQMREALAYDLFRRADISAPRTAFVQLYLTIPGRVERQHLGLYTLIEAVEGEFLKQHFETKAGLLAKPEMMQGLEYMGDNWRNYPGRYRVKGDVDPVAAKRLIEFARFIQEANPSEFTEQLKDYVDPKLFLRFVALNAILANVDSFIGNGHNYYLFISAKTRQATFIPWDLNEAFGMHPVSGRSGDQLKFSVLRPNADPNHLVERAVADRKLGPEYRAQCAWIMTNLFVADRLHSDIDRIASVTRRVVFAESPRAKADFERTVLAREPADDPGTSQPRHDPEIGRDNYHPLGFPDAVEIDNLPLKDWITRRQANVRDQLDGRTRGRPPRARLSF